MPRKRGLSPAPHFVDEEMHRGRVGAGAWEQDPSEVSTPVPGLVPTDTDYSASDSKVCVERDTPC